MKISAHTGRVSETAYAAVSDDVVVAHASTGSPITTSSVPYVRIAPLPGFQSSAFWSIESASDGVSAPDLAGVSNWRAHFSYPTLNNPGGH